MSCDCILFSHDSDLYSRELLDSYLSRALNVELEKGRLSVIDESAYVLTLDYTIKMLNIHERYECGIPVIIEGETGVGKTALVEMLSKLWNQSLLLEWKKQRGNLLDFFQKELGDMDIISDNYQVIDSVASEGCTLFLQSHSLPKKFQKACGVCVCVYIEGKTSLF